MLVAASWMTPERKAFDRAWDSGKARRAPADALADYARALKLHVPESFDEPEDADSALCDLWSDIAAAHAANENLSEALQAIDRSLQLHAGYNPTPLYNKGVILSKLGQYREAIEHFDRAIAQVRQLYVAPPDEVGDYLVGKGNALEALGDRVAALETYFYALPVNKGRSLHPDAKCRIKALTGKTPKRQPRHWPAR